MDHQIKEIVDHVGSEMGLENQCYTCGKIGEDIRNYFGILIPITLSGVKSGKDTKISLIAKLAPEDHKLKSAGVVSALYNIEIYVYSKLLPLYKELRTNIDIDRLIPACYYTDLKSEVLVLKDMKVEGFQRYTGAKYMDKAHLNIALESLAKFHGLSIISEEKSHDIGTDILCPYTSEYPPIFQNYSLKLVQYTMSLFTDGKIKSFLGDVIVNYNDYVDRGIKEVSRTVIGHGDYWKENMLFKYENNVPVEMCMLDFQGTRQMSPADDFLSFILTEVDSTHRRQNFTEFLNIYLETLQNTLKENHIDGSIIYSMKDFQNDLQKVALACFIKANLSFILWLGLDDELKDFKYKSESEKTLIEQELKDIVTDIALDLEYLGYITLPE